MLTVNNATQTRKKPRMRCLKRMVTVAERSWCLGLIVLLEQMPVDTWAFPGDFRVI